MIELKINGINKELMMVHDLCCQEHLVDELTMIIDTIVADYVIKNSPKHNGYSLAEKEKLITQKRNEILILMTKKECTCQEYLQTDDTYIREDDF